MPGFIYEWTNIVNGKKYIGSHIGDVNDNYLGSGVAFNRAVKKYGINNFIRNILEFVENDREILEKEQHYLDLVNAAEDKNYYNLKSKAGGGWEYVNSNMSDKEKEDRIKHMKTIQPMSSKFKGKKHTHESWNKTRTAWKEWADKNLKRSVLQYDLNMNFIREYESINEAARAVNGNPSNIKYTIEGTFSKAYGFKWKYKEKN